MRTKLRCPLCHYKSSWESGLTPGNEGDQLVKPSGHGSLASVESITTNEVIIRLLKHVAVPH